MSQYPLISRDLLADLRLAHGAYNIVVFFLFLIQARLGIQIRRERRLHRPLPFPAIKRHRKNGPLLVILLAAGYIFGIVLVLLNTGNLFEYALHFGTGTLLVLTGGLTLGLGLSIKGQDSRYRTRHFAAGLTVIGLFILQIFLGLAVLF